MTTSPTNGTGISAFLRLRRRPRGLALEQRLIRAAEAWARRRRYPTLTLNVFERNRHARDVYEHLGFEPDTIRYLKKL